MFSGEPNYVLQGRPDCRWQSDLFLASQTNETLNITRVCECEMGRSLRISDAVKEVPLKVRGEVLNA